MNYKQTINSFSARTVDRLTSARRATLTTLATFLIAMTAQTAWAYTLQFPTSSGGAGTAENPYKISNVDDLNKLYQDVHSNDGNSSAYNGKYFIVTQDIAYNPSALDANNCNFYPIKNENGNYNYPFAGTFDGGGHTISGIRICNEGGSYLGLFGEISPAATVKNVILADMRITGKTECGGIVGESQGTIENCHVTSTVEIHLAQNGACNIGGIAGSCSTKKISGCTSAVTISHASNLTDIRNIGGIVGDARTLVENNLVIGATIPAALRDDSNNSYGAVGGINIGATFSNNYYTNCTVAGTANATNVGVGADISNNPIGDITENNGAVYDVLWGFSDGNDGSAEKPYVISTTAGLAYLALKVNGGTDYSGNYFKLGDDITYNKTVENNFTPIGNASNGFRGTFDGNGKTISGLNINLTTTEYVGLFGKTLNATIKGVKLDNSTITGKDYVGGIVGFGDASSTPTTIENCTVTSNVSVSGAYHVGGIVGMYAKVRVCTSAAAVSGVQNVGGIVGQGDFSTIECCLYTGSSVTASDASFPYNGAITGSKNSTSMTANYYTQATIGGCNGSDEAGPARLWRLVRPRA